MLFFPEYWLAIDRKYLGDRFSAFFTDHRIGIEKTQLTTASDLPADR
jgi:hypothetical protein